MIPISRRAAVVGAAAALGACAPLRRIAPAPRVLVNLSEIAQPLPSEGAGGAELAMTPDLAERMMVPLTINGSGPHDFVVDTGANHSVIAIELAAALGLPSAGSAQVHGIAGVEPAPTVLINRLEVGEVASRRVRAPALPEARLGARGLLGVDVLKNRRVTIDFKQNQLRIAPSAAPVQPRTASDARTRNSRITPPPDPSLVTVEARYRFGQLIIVDADVGGIPVTAFLDSGSQNTVGNIALYEKVAITPGFQSQVTRVELVSATGQTASGDLSRIPALRLGGLRIGRMSAVFTDLHVFKIWDLLDKPAILIGVDVMRHFETIELDFGKRRVTFRTPPARAPTPASAPVG